MTSGWVLDVEEQEKHDALMKKDRREYDPDRTRLFLLDDTGASVAIRDDGCVDYHNFELNRITDGPQYWHICNIQQEIDRLESIKELARNEFGEHWG